MAKQKRAPLSHAERAIRALYDGKSDDLLPRELWEIAPEAALKLVAKTMVDSLKRRPGQQQILLLSRIAVGVAAIFAIVGAILFLARTNQDLQSLANQCLILTGFASVLWDALVVGVAKHQWARLARAASELAAAVEPQTVLRALLPLVRDVDPKSPSRALFTPIEQALNRISSDRIAELDESEIETLWRVGTSPLVGDSLAIPALLVVGTRIREQARAADFVDADLSRYQSLCPSRTDALADIGDALVRIGRRAR